MTSTIIKFLVALVFAILGANWVYDDAKEYENSGIKIKPTYWAAGSFLLLFPVFPLYLIFKFAVYDKHLKSLNKSFAWSRKHTAGLVILTIFLVIGLISLVSGVRKTQQSLQKNFVTYSNYEKWKNDCALSKGQVVVIRDRVDYKDCLVEKSVLRLEGMEELNKFNIKNLNDIGLQPFFMDNKEYRHAKEETSSYVFKIKELNLEMDVPIDLGLLYIVKNNNSDFASVNFSSKSLVDFNNQFNPPINYCNPEYEPLGIITKSKNKPQQELPPNNKVVNGYYVYFIGPQKNCSDRKEIQDETVKEIGKLISAFNTIRAY